MPCLTNLKEMCLHQSRTGCNRGSASAPAAAKTSGYWPRAHGGDAMGSCEPLALLHCAPYAGLLLCSVQLWSTYAGKAAKPAGKLGAGAGGSWRRCLLVMQHPRGSTPSASLAGAAQTGRLRRSRSRDSGNGSCARPSGSCHRDRAWPWASCCALGPCVLVPGV